ncbi:hypothetical protein GpartN1_g5723.t1 [Galdieria partita]|uniref:Uncharacterized protein n=1 Tax=Galdieria partita TaxID=83374 RepID=A0A9C7Q2E0_9RHOD|nr:hypothetical protein GpartN1_g5723.t1 [Galdieria partita]
MHRFSCLTFLLCFSTTKYKRIAKEYCHSFYKCSMAHRSWSLTMIPPTVNEVASALAGGTVGVMGTLLVLEVIRQRIEEMRQCPYCRGLRKLPCGLCFGMGFIPDVSCVSCKSDCENCGGEGSVICCHCDGSGRYLPVEYERALFWQGEEEWNHTPPYL